MKFIAIILSVVALGACAKSDNSKCYYGTVEFPDVNTPAFYIDQNAAEETTSK